MRLWSVPPLMLALLWALASVAMLRAAEEPGDRFLQVYESYQAGAKLENEGKLDDASQKFQFCVTLLEQIQRASPDYYPILIDSRLKKSRAAIARVRSMQQSPGSVSTVFDPAPPVIPRIGSSPGRFDRFPQNYRVPGVGSSPPEPQVNVVPETTDQLMSRGAINALKEEINSLREQLGSERQANEDLNRRVLESMAREQSAQKEVDLWKVRDAEQQSQLAQIKQSLDDLQQANGRLSKEKESDQRQIAGLQKDLDAARADLEVAAEYNDELFAKLGQAAKFIDADEQIRKQLLAERKELDIRASSKSGDRTKIEKERDAAVAKRDTLQKQIDTSGDVANQNKNLSKKLADAERQLSDVSKDKEERKKIEDGLRAEVTAVNKTQAAMRDELKSGQKRIAELEKQLSETADASASVTGEMADENSLLKSLVSRQLKEQAKRQQARKLVEEEMEKLQVRSASLLERLSALAGEEVPLSAKEKKLVDQPMAMPGERSDFALEVVKKTPESDLPPELVARASEANELAQKRKFSESKNIYAEIAQKAPKSYLAVVNLGIAQRQLGDYPQAVAAFQRALELKPNDPFALTNLGTVQYRNGDLAEAAITLQQAVAADSESYLAHYLLGMALSDKGDQEGARREVRRSLDLKSDYAPAMELDGELRSAEPQPSPEKSDSKAAE